MRFPPPAEYIIAAFAVVFYVLAIRDWRRNPGPATPARKARLRIAIIFTIVSIALFVMHAR